MPTLTDEERAKAILGDVELEEAAETTEEAETLTDEEQGQAEVEESEDETAEDGKTTENETETDKTTESSFTKQFPNLKGETPGEYLPELEKAYDNSFKEALRLNDLLKEKDKAIQEAAAVVDRANQIIAQAKATNPDAGITALPPEVTQTTSPEIEWIRGERRRVMLTAFDEFKIDYPQVLDQQEFERFRLASDGMKAALTASTGREPTDTEIFKAIAGSFGWQPAKVQAKKDAAIKENASSSRATGNQSAATTRKPKVSEAQIDAYQRMLTSKTREEAIKELSEVV